MFQWLNAMVVATDSGVPPRSSFVELSVSILDKNDNNPVFDFGDSEYGLQVEVKEDTSPGTIIATVKATDIDSGENGKVTYFLDRRSSKGRANDINIFEIHPDTGELSLQGQLDREEQSMYTVIVQAYDNYQFGKNSRTRYTSISV